MEGSRDIVIGICGVSALFVAIYLGALWILSPVVSESVEPSTGTGDAFFGVLFVVALLIVTIGMLAAFRFGFGWLIRYVVLGITGIISFIVFSELIPGSVFETTGIILPLAGVILLVGAVALHPEWWVINLTGVVVGIGAVALFGMTFGLRVVLLLLIVLAIYDFISVYKTHHMLSLAEGALAGRLPVVLFVPTRRGVSLRESAETDADEGFEGVIVIGLGDAIIPGMLVTSAVISGPAGATVTGGFVWSLPAVGAIVGILLGVVVLFGGTARDTAHPGLPFLSSGAILGYLVASLVVGIDPLTALTLAGS